MSATPYVALLGAVQKAGIKVKPISGEMPREKKRWIVRSILKPDPNRIPNNTIVYSTAQPVTDNKTKRKPKYFGINEKKKGNCDAILAHPTLCFGWSPPIPVTNVVIDFRRPIMTSTSDPTILQMCTSMPI